MMGSRNGVQQKLFYSFNLDDHVPEDHLLRAIDRCLDLSKLRKHLTKYTSAAGATQTAWIHAGSPNWSGDAPFTAASSTPGKGSALVAARFQFRVSSTRKG